MADFHIRADSVDVEQIMETIRARIREKRGVDYTEEQVRELASVKLERFLDPSGVRSELLDEFRRSRPQDDTPPPPSFTFEPTAIYDTHRGFLRFIRKLLRPVLKLFFNPTAVAHALHTQANLNGFLLDRVVAGEHRRRDLDALYYELIHNLVVELTRLGIEIKNLKMRAESLSSRLEFNERRARALESVVVYKPMAADSRAASPAPPGSAPGAPPARRDLPPSREGTPAEGPGQRSRRRRRRRGRRVGPPAEATMAGQPAASGEASADRRPTESEPALAEPEPKPLAGDSAGATTFHPGGSSGEAGTDVEPQ